MKSTRLSRAIAERDRGTVIVLASLLIVSLCVMAAMALDVGYWYNTSTKTQRAADISALAAVEELSRVELATGNRAAAETAAEALAKQIATENGYDPNNVTVTITTDAFGADQVTVNVLDPDLDMFFAGLVIDQIDVQQDAKASMNDCNATCGDKVLVTNGIQTMVDAGTGGDGWRPTLTDNELVYNLFHHGSGDVLQCVDKSASPAGPCVVGGNSSFYPVEPYNGIETNYTPKLAAVGSKVYFVVQENNTVGLGCWDGDTHAKCAGAFSGSPVLLENYDGGGTHETRIDGPEVVGNRLFMWGDNGVVYCLNDDGSVCSGGYPIQSALRTEGHEMTLTGSTYADGVDTDQMQFDMEPTVTGDKIFLSLTPAPSDTWLTCWDTTTNATCGGFSSASTADGRPFLFLTYNTANALSGFCARGGHQGGGSGHECFNLAGSSTGFTLPFNFSASGNRATQQSGTGTTTFGNIRTFFPYRGNSSAECWDWTINAVCAIPASNWSATSGTGDYAYIYDGNRCMYGLGHAGLAWTFDIDTGQFPCPGDGSGNDTIYPCTCADGVTQRWTSLVLTPDTNLAYFDTFLVTVKFPDGTVYETIDMKTVTFHELDLRPLNLLGTPPASMTVEIEAEVTAGFESVAMTGTNEVGVVQISGVLPTLVD